MDIIPLGDYYAWYCDWCDTRNLTLQQKFVNGSVACGACHRHFVAEPQKEVEGYSLCGGF